MLRGAIDACPATLWTSDRYVNPFWQVAYHTLFYTHLYLQPQKRTSCLGSSIARHTIVSPRVRTRADSHFPTPSPRSSPIATIVGAWLTLPWIA
jgi:hypothetical protein